MVEVRSRGNSVSPTQKEKGERFRALHDEPGTFILPNPWDVGSALILAGLGFRALATSSAASACSAGRRDGRLTRDEALAHARLIVDATDLPVSADLEKGFGDAPEVGGGNHPACGRGGTCRMHDRGCYRQPDSPLYDTELGCRTDCCGRAKRRAHSRFRSSWLRERTIFSMPPRVWTRPSAVFKPSKKQEPTCFSPRACLTCLR